MNRAADKPRFLVPRWYSFSQAIEQGEAVESNNNKNLFLASFEKDLDDWEKAPVKSIGLATSLIGSAALAGLLENANVRNAAGFVLASDAPEGSAARSLARQAYGQTPESPFLFFDAKSALRILKKEVVAYPKNPVAWIDLARLYVQSGSQDKAARAVQIGLQMGSCSRFVIRSAIRYFLHVKDKERALWIARKASLNSDDFWLVSAELAISQINNKNPRCIKTAKHLLDVGGFDPKAVSELSISFANLEYTSGNDRRAKKLARLALNALGENSAAQAAWLAPRLNLLDELQASLPSDAFEAQYRLFKQSEDYRNAVTACERAVKFHPIAASLAEDGSFISALYLGDHAQAIRIIDAANPDAQKSFLLHNNKACSLACSGNTDDAKISHEKAGRLVVGDGVDHYVHLATRGLIEFRMGNIERGRAFYRKAIRGFELGKQLKETRLATLFWANEEVEASTNIVDPELLTKAPSAIGSVRSLLDTVRDKLDAIPCTIEHGDIMLI